MREMVRVRGEEIGLVKIIHRCTRVMVFAAFAPLPSGLLMAVAIPALAQEPPQESSPKPPEAAAPAPAKKQDKSAKDSPNIDSATKNEPDQPMWNTLRANRDTEVSDHQI